MGWHGYVLIEIAAQLTPNTVDEDGNVIEEGTRSLVRRALLQLGRQSGPSHKITCIRPSNDRQSVILELELTGPVTKTQVVTKLAELLPWSVEQITNNVTCTVSPGANWEERRQATDNYLVAHAQEWE